MAYLAIINTPGYLPDTEPVEFETAGEAWEYLANDRAEHEMSVLEDGQEYEPSETLVRLRKMAGIITDALFDTYPTGTITGPTPGSQSRHDIGIAYTVIISDND